ncbi:polysaccharide pyruvyl transferase family protein [Rhodococcus sp. AG1013]|uniref:polysaccharide pyruvyl transferase family protein n=1 Tax=unclassified Rhodococcus (in: high G+C Gram-positive bacteria) TaxID=192944 RepID=UPI000E0AB06D|nr:polysaccharide pyruvyl transferase family protein [Rhodococcus sp. AG1013]RDI26794.1 polysaccharide pyruvyl transferase WcaK-like protein [Rhodococcus sp. AG1013]
MIYYWCAGQDDNVGDIILRRRMLRSLQAAGPSCDIYVGKATRDFIAALGARPEDKIYTSFVRFIAVATLHSLRKDWMFGFNPGEIKCNRKQSVMHALLIPMMLISLIHGKRCVRVGVGVGMHEYRQLWRNLIWVTVLLAKVNVWRDAASRDVFGKGTVGPDWAFDEALEQPSADEESSGRGLLAVSLRADSPATSPEWTEGIRELARELGLIPTVVVQVKRDSARARELAAALECEIVDWIDESHTDQEKRLRYTYRKCEVVVSDRLHVLIMALTEGAVPLGLMEHEDEKVARHFAAAGFDAVSWDVRGWDTQEIVIRGAARARERNEIELSTRIAQSRVRALDSVVRA